VNGSPAIRWSGPRQDRTADERDLPAEPDPVGSIRRDKLTDVHRCLHGSHRMMLLSDRRSEHPDRCSALVDRFAAVPADDLGNATRECIGRPQPTLGTHRE
jgi:hypothetical protein